MPVNTTSTGATYGKSSDPLCPLGFHPQVRWPTRCKRCFRDYKEHSDDSDRARFSNLQNQSKDDGGEDGHWASGRRSGFRKAQSLDVTMMSESRARSDQQSSSSGVGSRTSQVLGGSEAKSGATEDIPDWKKSMLERQAARQREIAEADEHLNRFRAGSVGKTTASSSAAGASASSTGASAAATSAQRSTSWQRNSYSSTSEDRSGYSTSTSGYSSDAAAATSSSSRTSSSGGPGAATAAAATTAIGNRARRADSEDHDAVYRPFGTGSSSTPGAKEPPKPVETKKTPSWERTPKPVAASKAAVEESKPVAATTASSSTPSWKSSYTSSKTAEPAATKTTTSTTTTPSWKSSYAASSTSSTNTTTTTSSSSSPAATTNTPSWKKSASAAQASTVVEEKPAATTPSWKKPATAATTTSTTATTTTSSSVPAWKQQQKSKLSSISETKTTSSLSPTPATASTESSSPFSSKSSASASSAASAEAKAEAEKLKKETEKLKRESDTLKRESETLRREAGKSVKLEAEVKDLKEEVGKLQRNNTTLKRERDDLEAKASKLQANASASASSRQQPMSFESAKASETAAELLRAKEKISDLESANSRLETEKKGMKLKLKETEGMLEKRPQAKDTNKTILEMETKLKYLEKKSEQLEKENNYLQSNVQNLEGELEEVQDNFREDDVDEYRHLKRDLEASAKNCRVLQFKLKKAEKTIVELSASGAAAGGGSSGDATKIRQLEKDLDQKTQVNKQLEQQISDLKSSKGSSQPQKGRGGPVLSRTGSVERSYEEQLLKDLQDSVERENDLKEQLNMAEDETTQMRKKLSRLEDETESLGNQLKKMTRKGASSGTRGGLFRGNSDEGISQDGEELTMAELKVQLEVSEGETGLLRKKVEGLLTDNLKLTKEIKEANKKSSKASGSSIGYGSSGRGNDESAKLNQVQEELNNTRVKLIEKEREVERLDTQMKAATKGKAAQLKRQGSQDLSEKLEKEAQSLRERTNMLEQENEKLAHENRQLLKDQGKKRPSSTQEKLSMDKFALEEKVKKLEMSLKDKDKEIHKLADTTKLQQQSSIETDRLKREKNSLEYEVTRQKSNVESEKRRAEKLERDMAIAAEKADKAQREVVNMERDRRKLEDDKHSIEDRSAKFEAELRLVTRERDRLRDESESARQKNRDNLAQTQEGIKAFKEQIESLKKEVSDEKARHRDSRRTSDDKVRSLQTEVRTAKASAEEGEKAVHDLEMKVKDLEDKWSKSKRINKQKQDKIDSMEAQMESASAAGKGGESPTALKKKIAELESKLSAASGSSALQRENTELKRQVEELKSSKKSTLSAGGRSLSGDAASLKQELDDTIAKHELLEEEYVVAKAKLQMERDEMKADYDAMQSDYGTIKNELATLRRTYSTKSDAWIKEKLDFQQRLNDLGDSLRSSAGEGWESERERFKNIIGDRDSQITQLKIEGDVTRSQVAQSKKEIDDLKIKLADYEKMSKFQKAVSSDSTAISGLESKLDQAKKQLASVEKDHKSEVNTIKMKHDSKVALMGEEIAALKAQSAKYRRERETLKEMMDSKPRSGRTSAAGDESTELRHKVSDLTYQMQVLEDELAEAKMTASKSNANSIALKSNYEIQVAELNSRINEMEEEALIESGRARIAGTRTKMELAWQKERESQKKLINELNTMARDLKATLLEVEKERDRERLESKRKINGMKSAFTDEQDDTKKQITDLQYDLLELRDAHAKLRTTNEKLRRDKDKTERERDEFRYLVKERTRGEQGEEKKLSRMLVDMDDMFGAIGKTLGDDVLTPTSPGGSAVTVDARAKANLKTYLSKLKEAKDDLEHIHKVNEEERERMSSRRSVAKTTRGGSVEVEGDETPRGVRGGSRGRDTGGRKLFRKTMSEISEDGAGGGGGLSVFGSEAGSQESLASNASIPLPIPVRTRSAHGGDSDSGYNAMSIRRLERDTSVDRLSTGSGASNMSTQSEWVDGQKVKKKSGLIGKLKKLTRKSEEREFGSGSDISSFSVQSSATSVFQKAQEKARKRSSSKDRTTRAKTPAEANEPFDKYFSGGPGGATSAAGPFGPTSNSSSNGSQRKSSTSGASAPSSSYTRRY